MRRGLLVAALVGGLLPGAAQAQWTVGLRTSVAVAGGDAVKGSPMSDGVKRQFPVELEVSRRLLPWLDVGALGAWGVGQVGATCQGSCSASVLRLGIQAAWRLDPVGEVLPWVGLGVGYEWARYRVSEGGDTLRVTLRGVELLQLQGGADWSVGTRLTIGPFASVALGRYDHLTVGSPFGESSGGVPSRATHAWFGLGVRGSWRL